MTNTNTKTVTTNTKTIGERIKALREEKGLTQKELASAVSASAATINNWERGKAKPTWKKTVTVAEYFHVFPQWLNSGNGPRNKSEEEALHRKKIEESRIVIKTKDEQTLCSIRLCIEQLPSAGKACTSTELEVVHEYLSELRTKLEKKVLFGKKEAPATQKAWTGKDARQLEDTDISIDVLPEMNLKYEEKKKAYEVLAGIREELELKKLFESCKEKEEAKPLPAVFK